jgi:hypothetical protein
MFQCSIGEIPSNLLDIKRLKEIAAMGIEDANRRMALERDLVDREI